MIHTGLPPSYLPSVPWGPLLPLYTLVWICLREEPMLPGGYILSLVSPDGEKGSSEDFKLQQIRRFFFREEHHASQPVLGWFYFSKITDMDFDRKNSEMQRCCDLLNVTKVFNGRIQTRPGGHKRHLCPRSGSTVCLNGVLASLVISQGQLCTLGSEGLPWILGGPTTEGHGLGLNWAGVYFFVVVWPADCLF